LHDVSHNDDLIEDDQQCEEDGSLAGLGLADLVEEVLLEILVLE
jgi:hypothetical protein